MTATSTMKPARNPRVASRTLEDNAVLVFSDRGEVKVLNGSATLIWNLIDGRKTVAEIVEAVMNTYEVDEGTASGDVESFLDEMKQVDAVVLES